MKSHRIKLPFRILLVGSDADESLSFRQAIETRGISVHITRVPDTGEVMKAIEIPEENTGSDYDLLMVASELAPSDPSYDFLHRLKEKHISLLTVLLFDIGKERSALEAFETGADYCLIKDREGLYLKQIRAIVLRSIRQKEEGNAARRTEENLRESEEKYRSMMEAMQDPVYICSPDFRVAFMNPAMIRRTGYDAVGERCYKALHDRESVCPRCLHRKSQEGEYSESEICSPKDGRFYHVSDSPIFHADGTISKMTVFRDITEIRRIEDELRQAKEAAESATRAKDEFLSNMSHEIRTPMNAVIGILDLMRYSDLGQELHEFLECAKSAADSLMVLLEGLLGFSAVKAAHIVPEEKNIEIRPFLENFVKPLRVKAGKKSLSLSLDIAEDIPDVIVTDPNILLQILSNLSDNAVKFTEKGGIGIEIRVRGAGFEVRGSESEAPSYPEPLSPHLLFRLSDTGIGIPSDRIRKIFEQFTQADGSLTRMFGGTGMGITISARLVEMLGGRIWAESREGEGSTFYFTIKVKAGQSRTVQEISPGPRLSFCERKLKILLTEDNLPNRKLAQKILESRGHIVRLAVNGKEALEAFEEECFDLILMDVQMPVMDGLEAARRIREKEKKIGGHVPIVAMTAHAVKEDRERCLSAGMDTYMAKPVRLEKFLSIAEKLNGKNRPETGTPASEPVGTISGSDAEAGDVFKMEEFLEIAGGNQNLAKEVIRLYLESLPKFMDQIREGIAEGDGKALEFASHALKGMSYNLSARRVAQAASDLEKTGRERNLEPAPEMYSKLKAEAELLKAALEKIYSSPP